MGNGYGVSPIELQACEAALMGLVYLDDFTYSAIWEGPTALLALATLTVPIQINGDSDFVVQEQNLIAYDNQSTPANVAIPNLLLTITRSGSGREIMDAAQHVNNMCGNYTPALNPGRNPMPSLWHAKNTISVKLQNLTSTVFGRIQISFRGFKVFYIQNSKGQTGDRTSIFHAL